ncbi:MAG: ABC transporter substrate-binding protein [Sulfuricaulis sp.]
MSDSSAPFVGVQREIRKRADQPIRTYILGDDESANAAVQRRIQFSAQPVVVAIGLPAAQVARSLTGKKVIFCQVFNYEDPNLVTPWMKGVSATAPAHELFRTWKQLFPGLKKVGVITGKNLTGLMKEARAAARQSRITLVHVEVRSDKQTLYSYKRLAPAIQGLWLVPDNRVLSIDVIRDMMAHSVREGKQVAVFGNKLLDLGGIISAETSYADIAEHVLTRVAQSEHSVDVPGAPVIPLTRAIIRINSVMAMRLNLKISKALQGMAYVP